MSEIEQALVSELSSLAKYNVTYSYPPYEIWKGMTGKIWVLHSAWNKRRVCKEIVDAKSTVGKRIRESNINEEMACKVIDIIAKYGNFTTEGDLIALDHIMSVLRCLYPPEDIDIMNSWCFGQEMKDVLEHDDFNNIKKDNIVLICGPVGNLATGIFLEQAGMGWLFEGHSIRVHPEKKPLEPEGDVSKEDFKVDYGVFLRAQNPFNHEKRIYAVMGAYAFGTQGAAAFGCSEESDAELVRASRSADVKSLENVDYIGWIKVWKYPVMKDFGDRQIKFQLVYPEPPKGIAEWKVHENPSSIVETFRKMKAAAREGTVFLGSCPSTLLGYTLFLSAFVVLLYALLIRAAHTALLGALILIVGLGTTRMLVAIVMPRKSYRRAKHARREKKNVQEQG